MLNRRALLRGTAALAVLGLAAVVSAATPAPAVGQRGMVVTSQVDASHAGVELLARGGNAVDAAVAAAFALAVTQPFSTGIGGGAFVLIRQADGKVIALDCRETAPAAATADMYVRPGVPERASLQGGLAVATPGLVDGLSLALARYGTKTLAEVLAPAIRLADQGFAIGPYHAHMLEELRGYGLDTRFPETGRIQFPPPDTPIQPGWVLVQKDLARTLGAIARQGPDAFYRGEIARRIAAEVKARGGILTEADLAGYEPHLRQPLWGAYRDVEVASFPPPSSGGVALIEALNILEGFELAPLGVGSSASLHRIAEALKLAFADRAAYLGDPDFVQVPVAALISKRYAAELRARIDPPRWRRWPWTWLQGETAIEVEGPGQLPDDAGTTHLSVGDAAGNAVAITETINTPFGSGITVPGTGIVLNNEMDDFSKAVDTPNVYGLLDTRGANAVAPGKRPLSSMTPSFVLHDGRLLMVTGSPGGPRIISTVLETILDVVDYGMDVQAAVAEPRIHHQWMPDVLYVEPAVPADVVEGLRRRGHTVEVVDHDWSAAEAIEVEPESGWLLGGSDPRRDGLALGY
jgi:gamma-glutamyltranspeptidase/glutathione hydrolase